METMSPLFRAIVGSLVRSLLVGLAGYLVAHDIWTGEQATSMIDGLVVALVGLAWSIYQKYRAHQTVLDALQTPAGTSLEKFTRQQSLR